LLISRVARPAKKNESYLSSQFLRLKARRGPKKAILAVAASMLPAAYHMLRDDVPYQDLGPYPFERRDTIRTAIYTGDEQLEALRRYAWRCLACSEVDSVCLENQRFTSKKSTVGVSVSWALGSK
jgi:hypothetical protein